MVLVYFWTFVHLLGLLCLGVLGVALVAAAAGRLVDR